MMLQRANLPWRRVGTDVLVARPGREDLDVLRGRAAAAWLFLERPAVLEAFSIEARSLVEDLVSLGIVEEAPR